MQIQMNSKEVLSLLKGHREKHIEDFTSQMEGWKKAMEKYADDLAVWRDGIPNDIFEQGKHNTKRPNEPQRPVSFVKDYDKMIELLEHHVGETIGLEQYEFEQIVKDEFGWKGQFLTNSALYSNAQ